MILNGIKPPFLGVSYRFDEIIKAVSWFDNF